MSFLVLYFQLHQPFRLHPDRKSFLWDEKNEEIFTKLADRCYLPAIEILRESISKFPNFKITLGISGTFIEQAELYNPEVIQALQGLLDAGKESNQVEILDETYYHSLSSLFLDPQKKEFRDQVSLHRDKIRTVFGIRPTSFRNTELIYNNEIARVVDDMGYVSILCERKDNMVVEGNYHVDSNQLFRAKESNLIIIPRCCKLSNVIALSYQNKPVSPEEYTASILKENGDVIMLGYDLEHIGGTDKRIFDFWRELPAELTKNENIILATPTEIAEQFRDEGLPKIDVEVPSISRSAELSKNTFGWVGTLVQCKLLREIEEIEEDAKKDGIDLLKEWRHITTSDHIYFLNDKPEKEHIFHSYSNPYEGSITHAVHILTHKITDLNSEIKRFEILKKTERTTILIIAPETGRLPEHMSALARFISGKSGGLGEVVTALCEGLIERDINVHLATLNLKSRFKKESHIDEEEWRVIRYNIDPDKIHLVSSSIFADLASAYSGNTEENAAEFQKELINHTIKEVRAKSKGKLIIHSHDWMAGGAISAYARSRGLPMLHTVHNVFTGYIPVEMMFGVDIKSLRDYILFSESYGKKFIDCQATAIKNATLINFVGKYFLKEIVDDYFLDRPIVPPSVREAVKEKYYSNKALSIINAPSPSIYPERCNNIVRNYGPKDNVIMAKRENLVEFQKRTGLLVNPDAILLYWPSRMDPHQKGIELLEDIVMKFVLTHEDVQIAVVGDGIGNDTTHEEIFGRIALASGGKITYQHFHEELSLLGYAAASDVFGASLYEPCGQIDQIGNIFGATATNRDTGGYHDKIRELKLKMDGSPQDVGNGFLFRDYDAGGLWYGLEKSVQFHRKSIDVKERQIKRIMKEARANYDLRNMVVEYIRLYEKLNCGNPLV